MQIICSAIDTNRVVELTHLTTGRSQAISVVICPPKTTCIGTYRSVQEHLDQGESEDGGTNCSDADKAQPYRRRPRGLYESHLSPSNTEQRIEAADVHVRGSTAHED